MTELGCPWHLKCLLKIFVLGCCHLWLQKYCRLHAVLDWHMFLVNTTIILYYSSLSMIFPLQNFFCGGFTWCMLRWNSILEWYPTSWWIFRYLVKEYYLCFFPVTLSCEFQYFDDSVVLTFSILQHWMKFIQHIYQTSSHSLPCCCCVGWDYSFMNNNHILFLLEIVDCPSLVQLWFFFWFNELCCNMSYWKLVL